MKTLPLPFQSHLFYYQVNKFTPARDLRGMISSQSLSLTVVWISIIFESVSKVGGMSFFPLFTRDEDILFLNQDISTWISEYILYLFIALVLFSFSFFHSECLLGLSAITKCHNFLQMTHQLDRLDMDEDGYSGFIFLLAAWTSAGLLSSDPKEWAKDPCFCQ